MISTRSWIEIIPKYHTHRTAAELSKEERERILKSYTKPKLPLPDLPPLSRIRLFKQDLLGAKAICQLGQDILFPQIADPRPIPDVKSKWGLIHYIQNRKREWGILGGWEKYRYQRGPPFFINLWEHIDTLDFIESEEYHLLERAARRIQFEFRSRLSVNRHIYNFNNTGSYHNSGYSEGPFSREFHRKYVARQIRKQEESVRIYTPYN